MFLLASARIDTPRLWALTVHHLTLLESIAMHYMAALLVTPRQQKSHIMYSTSCNASLLQVNSFVSLL